MSSYRIKVEPKERWPTGGPNVQRNWRIPPRPLGVLAFEKDLDAITPVCRTKQARETSAAGESSDAVDQARNGTL